VQPLAGPPRPLDPAARRPGPGPARHLLAALLFLVTLFTTTTVGAVLYLAMRTDVVTELPLFLGWQTVRSVWSDPALLATGLRLSLPTLLILLCHELGHYVVCRRYGYPVTPPYFLPAPFGLGTLGAFIRIGAPVRSKRELFDIGAAGPLAGFAALIPFLVWGVAASQPVPLPPPPEGVVETILLVPGRSLAMRLAIFAAHGPLPAGTTLDLHPFALAAWVGLLATALNLLPLGQLDGGHVLYAVAGRRHRRLALVLWLALLGLGLAWLGWVVWCLVILALGLRHPPVADESRPLGAGRMRVALLLLVIFVLSFAPVPLSTVAVS
jgi:membrane-associated protease RseP (regulator of RpoE activity)